MKILASGFIIFELGNFRWIFQSVFHFWSMKFRSIYLTMDYIQNYGNIPNFENSYHYEL